MKSFDEEVLDYEDGQSMFEGMLEVVECPEQVQKQRIIEESITMIPSCYLLLQLLLSVLSMVAAAILQGLGTGQMGAQGMGGKVLLVQQVDGDKAQITCSVVMQNHDDVKELAQILFVHNVKASTEVINHEADKPLHVN